MKNQPVSNIINDMYLIGANEKFYINDFSNIQGTNDEIPTVTFPYIGDFTNYNFLIDTTYSNVAGLSTSTQFPSVNRVNNDAIYIFALKTFLDDNRDIKRIMDSLDFIYKWNMNLFSVPSNKYESVLLENINSIQTIDDLKNLVQESIIS